MDFQKEALIKEVSNDAEFVKICVDNKITDEDLEKNILNIASYTLKKRKCNNCSGLANCTSEQIGYMPHLYYSYEFYTEYEICPLLAKVKEDIECNHNLITLGANLDDIDPKSLNRGPKRKKLYDLLGEIKQNYLKDIPCKGLYLHGKYGCGKSYIMGVYAKTFAQAGTKVVFAYFPELVRIIKSSIATGGVEQIVETLKKAEVLFIDDIGGELTSPYVRDEVLGAVLQDRMVNHKLTFMTSNLDKDNLHKHLSESSREIDQTKADRLMERIDVLMDFVLLDDKNYRKENI